MHALLKVKIVFLVDHAIVTHTNDECGSTFTIAFNAGFKKNTAIVDRRSSKWRTLDWTRFVFSFEDYSYNCNDVCVVKRLHQSLDEKHIDAHPTPITGFASYINIYCVNDATLLTCLFLCRPPPAVSVNAVDFLSSNDINTLDAYVIIIIIIIIIVYLIIIILCSNGKSPLHRACDNRFTEREVAEQCLVCYLNFC